VVDAVPLLSLVASLPGEWPGDADEPENLTECGNDSIRVMCTVGSWDVQRPAAKFGELSELPTVADLTRISLRNQVITAMVPATAFAEILRRRRGRSRRPLNPPLLERMGLPGDVAGRTNPVLLDAGLPGDSFSDHQRAVMECGPVTRWP
jgi:aryl carrier-like protein